MVKSRITGKHTSLWRSGSGHAAPEVARGTQACAGHGLVACCTRPPSRARAAISPRPEPVRWAPRGGPHDENRYARSPLAAAFQNRIHVTLLEKGPSDPGDNLSRSPGRPAPRSRLFPNLSSALARRSGRGHLRPSTGPFVPGHVLNPGRSRLACRFPRSLGRWGARTRGRWGASTPDLRSRRSAGPYSPAMSGLTKGRAIRQRPQRIQWVGSGAAASSFEEPPVVSLSFCWGPPGDGELFSGFVGGRPRGSRGGATWPGSWVAHSGALP